MPNHERKEKAEAAGTAPPQPPKGWMGVRVGLEGEEQQRFVVPVAYLSHPLFAELLDESAEEYGFRQSGAITIPCAVDHFRHVQDIIDRESGGGIAGLLHRHHHHDDRHHHHDDHHQQQQQQHHDDHDHHRQQQQQHHHDDHDHHQKQQQQHHHDHHHNHHQQQQQHHHLPHFTACFGAP